MSPTNRMVRTHAISFSGRGRATRAYRTRITAAREASVDAFHLAALVSAGLLVAGSVVNGLGLKAGSAAGAAASARDDRTAAADPTRAGAAPD